LIPPTILARLRSTSGIIIGLYVTMHLSNHALGLISLQTQETARPWVMALWHSPPGQILLYGSLATHAFCGLAALARRRQYRMPVWEGTQILLGLAIPYLLLVHIVNTRGTRILTGIDINYPYEIANLWVDPWTRYRQILLVLVVWGHFTVGLHFWLRIRAWYRRIFPALLLAYVLIPTGALLGFAEVGMTTTAHARSDPAWFKRMKTLGVPADPRRAATRAQLKEWVGYSWLALVGVVVCAAQIRNWRRRHERFTVTYPGDYAVEAPIGLSVLEVSRLARRPHVSVCGGRARCTTCRIRIDETAEELPSPNDLEAHALARIGAPAGVRLACQLRPHNDVSVYPLLHPDLSIGSRPLRGKEFGEERRVTILFIDLRGSTRLAEARLPYDVVFVLNHYFAEMAAAVEATGGHYSNFTGDGLMALFGLEQSDDHGAYAALGCALRMLERLENLNQQLASELAEPLSMGIGIHTGDAIIGQMGPPKTPVLTALGDAVNTAARLENATKELQVPVVVSRDTLEAAQFSAELPLHDILLRGRSTPLSVAALDKNSLRQLFASPHARESFRS
jgi:adenylate cyclase